MPSLLLSLLVPEPPGERPPGDRPPGDRRSRVRDAVADTIAVVAALFYGATMVLIGDATAPGARLPWQLDVAAGILCVLALPLRRRWPLGVLLAVLPFAAVSVMATGAVLVAFFSASIRLAPKRVLSLGAVYVVSGAVYYFLQVHPAYSLWVDFLLRFITGFAAIGWGLFVQAYRELTDSLRTQAERLAAEEAMRVAGARHAERTRIAREMHDVLAHRLSLVSLYAGALEVRADARPDEVAVAAAAIRSGVREALGELRSVIGVLRAGTSQAPEPPQPGLGDLPGLLDSARTGGMTIDYSCGLEEKEPSSVLGRTAYRLVQEGLTNARKHAPGAEVKVVVDGAAGVDLRIRITNPLPEAAAGRSPGLGLVGISERVALAGGRVEYGRERDRFRLEAWLPWPA